MRLALVEDGRVKNVILGELNSYPEYLDVSNVECGKGWLYDGETFKPEIIDLQANEIAWCDNELSKTESKCIEDYRKELERYKANPEGDRPQL